MPTTEDIREALKRNDVNSAKVLIGQISAKRNGKGLSGHDRQDFERQISRIHQLGVLPSRKQAVSWDEEDA